MGFEQFIASCERDMRAAPPGFAGSVMRQIEPLSKPAAPIAPVLSRKLCAAACFCSAAAIAFFTITGYERLVFSFISEQSGRLIDFVSALISK